MIEQNVQVVACEDGHIRVRMGSQSGCQTCENGKGCGAGVFAKLLQRGSVELDLPKNEVPVAVGQMVTLAFPEKVYLKLVMVSYGWPLLAALAGAWAGHTVAAWSSPGQGVVDTVTLVAGLVAGFLTLKYFGEQSRAEHIRKSLQSMVYFSASEPNMCGKAPRDKERIFD